MQHTLEKGWCRHQQFHKYLLDKKSKYERDCSTCLPDKQRFVVTLRLILQDIDSQENKVCIDKHPHCYKSQRRTAQKNSYR
jgi:hypothetical protein